ncbi:carbohydrate-binding module family 35 protein [Tilletiaria anomala UBC 951]|uniref:Alpha-galactosidase n=1 Tax=Tilletiaria anomala (strain ATCC 24038 / CBS 436.72 / UBC 951) TaxID=1037660 RepID=A0A066V6J9_TILAU|nr:carbohydrate-binding module family 35 protein [Tilletiaria anomala UBC 951]KDN37121.1 carbohydrate-binding module family 35 protein [Tilletiaria anomala UBC 951]
MSLTQKRLTNQGWNRYNQSSCSPNENGIQNAINALKSNGFVAAGYKYFQIDCGWQGTNRSANGQPAVNHKAFPNGLSALANSARSNGLLYTDAGLKSCDTRNPPPFGSLGYEEIDAKLFAFDNCYVDGVNNAPKDPRTDFPSRYGNMSTALQNNGINGMLVCAWGIPYASPTGLQGPAQWTPPLATRFRLSDDITNDWISVVRISNQAMNINLRGLHDPGHFADGDLLEVGNKALTFDEQKTHFALWAAMKPSILLNKDLIAINQDSLGRPITLVQRWSNDYDLYSGPLANGDVVVLLDKQGGNTGTKSIIFQQLNITSADVNDLWSGATRTGASSWSAIINAHGNIALRISNIKVSTPSNPTYNYYEAENAVLSNGAAVASWSGCSGSKKVGNIGTLTFKNIQTSQMKSNVRFDYINADVQYSFVNVTNARGASVSVNNGLSQQVYFPLSGYNWDKDVWKSFLVELSGFQPGKENTISISGGTYLSQYAPDIDRVGVVG